LRRRRVGLSRGRRRRKERGRREADMWGPIVSERKTKEKRKEAVWAGAGRRLMGRWAAGLKGGKVSFFFFFSFFRTLFKTNFSFQIQTKILLNFSQNFIIFLEATQATKNHANPNNDAQPLVVSILIKFSLIF
jgi:hypothetical protein